jgi:hypothetical protein
LHPTCVSTQIGVPQLIDKAGDRQGGRSTTRAIDKAGD